MAVAIRLKRCGRTHRPFYRIQAIERRNARDGKSLETIGTYDPFAKGETVQLKTERVQHWIDQGARPSTTVSTFLRKIDVKWGKPMRSRRSIQRAKRGSNIRSKSLPTQDKRVMGYQS